MIKSEEAQNYFTNSDHLPSYFFFISITWILGLKTTDWEEIFCEEINWTFLAVLERSRAVLLSSTFSSTELLCSELSLSCVFKFAALFDVVSFTLASFAPTTFRTGGGVTSTLDSFIWGLGRSKIKQK